MLFHSMCVCLFVVTFVLTACHRCELHGQLRAGPASHPLQELAHRGPLWQEVQAGLLRTQRSLHQQWLQGRGTAMAPSRMWQRGIHSKEVPGVSRTSWPNQIFWFCADFALFLTVCRWTWYTQPIPWSMPTTPWCSPTLLTRCITPLWICPVTTWSTLTRLQVLLQHDNIRAISRCPSTHQHITSLQLDIFMRLKETKTKTLFSPEQKIVITQTTLFLDQTFTLKFHQCPINKKLPLKPLLFTVFCSI